MPDVPSQLISASTSHSIAVPTHSDTPLRSTTTPIRLAEPQTPQSDLPGQPDLPHQSNQSHPSPVRLDTPAHYSLCLARPTHHSISNLACQTSRALSHQVTSTPALPTHQGLTSLALIHTQPVLLTYQPWPTCHFTPLLPSPTSRGIPTLADTPSLPTLLPPYPFRLSHSSQLLPTRLSAPMRVTPHRPATTIRACFFPIQTIQFSPCRLSTSRLIKPDRTSQTCLTHSEPARTDMPRHFRLAAPRYASPIRPRQTCRICPFHVLPCRLADPTPGQHRRAISRQYQPYPTGLAFADLSDMPTSAKPGHTKRRAVPKSHHAAPTRLHRPIRRTLPESSHATPTYRVSPSHPYPDRAVRDIPGPISSDTPALPIQTGHATYTPVRLDTPHPIEPYLADTPCHFMRHTLPSMTLLTRLPPIRPLPADLTNRSSASPFRQSTSLLARTRLTSQSLANPTGHSSTGLPCPDLPVLSIPNRRALPYRGRRANP